MSPNLALIIGGVCVVLGYASIVVLPKPARPVCLVFFAAGILFASIGGAWS